MQPIITMGFFFCLFMIADRRRKKTKSIKLVAEELRKCKRFFPTFVSLPEQPRVIVHIPHSSTNIPKQFQQEFLPEKEKLHSELLCMTDWYTDELFACPGCQTIVHQYSRLVCDPERFLDPEDEMMWQKGMGMYYTRMSGGDLLKRSPLSSSEGLQAYGKALKIYQQHHSRLTDAVQHQLALFDRAVLIDGHSFSETVLPYEPKENHHLKRPEICLGADSLFTPNDLLDLAKDFFTQAGLEVAVNTPFAGTMVPEPFYSLQDKRVQSLMIEVNRSLYMDERTGKKKETFDEVEYLLHEFLKVAEDRLK
jgi:N-formylglutamate amidohydrolase